MSTEFYNRNWRMPNSFNGSEDNNSKFSNYSMSFDGSSEHISVSSGTSFDFGSNPFSFSGWIKRASIGNSSDVIIHLQKSGSTPTVQVRQNVRNIKVDFNVGGSWTFLETSTNKIGNDTNWHHLAVTKSGTSMLVYIDGVVQAAGNNGIPATLDAGNGTTLIGARGGNTQNWDGIMDHLSVFDYELTQAQITQLYGSSSTGVGNPMAITNGRKPVAYYPIGDYSAFNGEYLVPNSAVSDYVFDFTATTALEGINIPKQSSIEPTVFTLSCWIKSESSQSAYAYPVYKESSNSAHVAYGFYLNGSSTIATTVTQNGVVSSDNIGDLRDNKWHHIVQSFDGSEMKVYLDGFQSGTTKTLTGDVSYRTGSSSGNDLCLGKASYSASGYFNFKGDISNVSLFNTALPATGTESVTIFRTFSIR